MLVALFCFQARSLRGGRLLGIDLRWLVTLLLSSMVVVRRPPLGHSFAILLFIFATTWVFREILLELPLRAARVGFWLQLMCSPGHVESAEQMAVHVSCAVLVHVFA